MDFHDLRRANINRQAEWDPQSEITLSYRGNELAGEVGEACNVIKKLERERLGIRGSRAVQRNLADELSDVVICVDLIAMGEGIDLGTSVRQKFNETSEKYGLHTTLQPDRKFLPAAEVDKMQMLIKLIALGDSTAAVDLHRRLEALR